MSQIDLLIHSAAQVVTCGGASAAPKRVAALRDVGLIPGGAVAIDEGRIVAVGPSDELRSRFSARDSLDASGKVVCPGFVDCHTHLVYAGDRVAEFEQRLQGASYLDILAAGGGILSTMRHTRAASVEQLVAETRPRLDAMLRLGTTTVEIKTGYGLDTASELRMLDAIAALATAHPADVVPTFLAAHAIPPEFKANPADYIDLIVSEMLPLVADWYAASPFRARGSPLFNDVFCERNAFDVEQSRRVLEAGRRHGLRPKIHADEFTALGGVSLALALDAISCDHLDVTRPDERGRLAQSDTVAVLLPAVNFNLGSSHFADARAFVDAGAVIALSTDMNPGSASCYSLPLVMAMACRYQKLLPAEALNACTINAAHAIGLADRVGSLEPGKQADVLVVDASDYRWLAYELGRNLVETVIKAGQRV